MVNTKKSKLMIERHLVAKSSKQFYEELVGKDNTPEYSEFLKRDNPLLDKIRVYDVSFELNYPSKVSKADNQFFVSKVNFKVYSFSESPETQSNIRNNTVDTFRNLQGADRNELNAGLKDVMDNPSYYDIDGDDKPRGLEENELDKLDLNLLSKLRTGSFYVEGLDNAVTIKNRSKVSYKGFVSDAYFTK